MDSNNDLNGMLSKLLSDPAALSSIMSIAGSLMNNLPKESEQIKKAEENIQPESSVKNDDNSIAVSANNADQTAPTSSSVKIPDLSALGSLAGNLGGGNKKSDPRCNLLNSLRPYMSHGRAEKIDMMIKALSLAELADGFLNNKKLF